MGPFHVTMKRMRPWMFWAVVGVLATRSAWADDLPDIKSRSAVVLDAKTGAEIFGKDADEIRPIASTTKIFVAMAVRKQLDLDGWTEITKVDAHHARGGARTRLDIGQTFRNKDLLRAMLIASDNRAPTALGRAAAMTPDDLVAAMNAIAKKLHLKHTKFTDPTGLRGNTSTAREMAAALREALADDVLRSIMHQETADIESKDHYAKIHYDSTNHPLLARTWDVTGGKTGYTKAAGYCFITGAKFNDREVMTAFLGADGKLTRFDDFNRVAAWLDRGAPGGKPVTKRPKHAQPASGTTAHGRVAETERSPEHRAKPEAPAQRSEGSAEANVRGGRMKYGLLAETERSPEHRAKPEAPAQRSEGSAEADVRGGRMKNGLVAAP